MKLATLVLSCLSFLPAALSLSSNPSWSNAKRLARGLPPLRPRRLYNPHVARDPVASATTSSSGGAPTPPTAAIRADYAGFIQVVTFPSRRQSIGETAGYLNFFGSLQADEPTTYTYATTTDAEPAVGVYPVISGESGVPFYMCLTNGNSYQSSRNTPINLSPNTGDYVYVGECDAAIDQPAGSGATNDAAGVERDYYGETRVWQIAPSGEVSFYYANTDGTVVPNQVAVIVTCPGDGDSHFVLVTANVADFLEQYKADWNLDASCSADALTLYFETS